MVFKEVKIENYAEISAFFSISQSRFCDYTTGALFMWADFFDNKFCIFEGALILCGRDVDGLISYTPPLCTRGNEEEVLRALYGHAVNEHGYLKLYPAQESKVAHYEELLKKVTRGGLTSGVAEDWFDYIYDADALLSLTGKKYHGQRNHINRFMRENPEYSLELIGKDNLEEVTAFAETLCGHSGVENKTEAYECMAVLRLLRNYDALRQEGYVLRVGNAVAGFTVGEVVGDTLFEHVEKADKSYAGIFPFMSHQYLRLMRERFPQIALVNREEDLGDKGIRYSKECYHPSLLNYKYFIICK